MSEWFVYIIETDKGNWYTGISTDPERRFKEHRAVYEGQGKARGAKYFRSQNPLAIVFQRVCDNRSQASKLEAEIKAMGRRQKQQLIQESAMADSARI